VQGWPDLEYGPEPKPKFSTITARNFLYLDAGHEQIRGYNLPIWVYIKFRVQSNIFSARDPKTGVVDRDKQKTLGETLLSETVPMGDTVCMVKKIIVNFKQPAAASDQLVLHNAVDPILLKVTHPRLDFIFQIGKHPTFDLLDLLHSNFKDFIFEKTKGMEELLIITTNSEKIQAFIVKPDAFAKKYDSKSGASIGAVIEISHQSLDY
jgi:hypothetical protein